MDCPAGFTTWFLLTFHEAVRNSEAESLFSPNGLLITFIVFFLHIAIHSMCTLEIRFSQA